MVCALNDNQVVVLVVFGCDIPGLRTVGREAAYIQALPLPERVVRQPAVFTDNSATGVFDLARVRGKVLAQEFRKRAFADKTDSGFF